MKLALLASLVMLSLVACSDEKDRSSSTIGTQGSQDLDRKPVFICTFAPTAYLTQRLAQEDAEIRVDLPTEADALFWSPQRELLAQYQKADLVILNGAGMDLWIERANLAPSRTVRTTSGIESALLEFEGSTEAHRHGTGEEHRHVGLDPHVWLDPKLALAQARSIQGALREFIPEPALEERFASLEKDLLELDERLRRITVSGREVLTSHPAYEYLEARYSWPLVALDLDPEEAWSPALEAAIEAALNLRGASERATHLVWEAAPQLEVATRLKAQFGIESWVADPAENLALDDELDWLERQRASAEVWERVLP